MKRIGILLVFFILIAVNVFAKDYVIGGGDSLDISVWGSPELSLVITVRPDGKISIPALGEIKAAGLTAMGLTDVLKKEMLRMVKSPIVTVIVRSMNNYRIFVFGKGAPSGVHVLDKEVTLLEFLSQLGSLENADLENSYLVRNKVKIKKGFHELFVKGDYSRDIVLEFNDMLFIPDNFGKRISIVGAVKHPVIIPYKEGLTILDVILSAGGFTDFAKMNKVTIVRKEGGGDKKELIVNVKDLMKGEIDNNISIKPGDFIIVKETLF